MSVPEQPSSPKPAKASAFWPEITWDVVQLGVTPATSFPYLWFMTSFVLFLILVIAYRDPAGVFMPAVLSGEFVGGVLTGFLNIRAEKPQFIEYSFLRIRRSRNLPDFSGRVQTALRYTRWFLRKRLRSASETFLLRPLHDPQLVPASERPRTIKEMFRVIAMDLLDRASREAQPWPTTTLKLGEIAAALRSPLAYGVLREKLCRLFVDSSPWYRERVVSPPPGRITTFLGARPWIRGLITVAISAAVTAATILAGRP